MRVVAGVRFRAMGSAVHVVVVGGDPAAGERAETTIRRLEGRWSRFLPDSEVSVLNRAGGSPVPVSEDTMVLVAAAREGWAITGGAFDPTVRPAVIAAGYPTADAVRDGAGSPMVGDCGGMEVDAAAGTVRFPEGTSFDPGGVGKGLAADLVVRELLESGAEGAMVNVGGDLRVSGRSPDGDTWTIAVEDPFDPDRTIWSPRIADGGLATSSTLIRRWRVGGVDRHHLVDPAGGGPPAATTVAATVVAGSGWLAEVLTKPAMVRPPEQALAEIESFGATGVLVDGDGRLRVGSRIGIYA